MTDAYNVAYTYLKGKYGQPCGFSGAFNTKLSKCRNANERKQMMLNITERDYDYVIMDAGIPSDTDDAEVYLLLKQYHSLSIEPKKDLEYKLTRMGIPFEKRYT